ncbi:MAG: hypothetical protein R3E66_08040 [bacterium]
MQARVSFVDVSAEAVGNLTHPVEVLRQRMYEELTSALTTLLRRIPNQTDPFVLDVFLVTAHSEPMATAATNVVLEAIHEIMTTSFAAVFPTRAGWHVILAGIVEGPVESARPRREVLEHLTGHLRWVQSQRQNMPVSRAFLLDAVTPQGISPRATLTDQIESLLMFLLFGGLRREALGVQLAEQGSPDLLATVGIARLEIPPGVLQHAFSKRLYGAVASLLQSPFGGSVTFADELVTRDDFVDANLRNGFSTRLRAVCLDALETHGYACCRPFAKTLDELLPRLDVLAEELAFEQRRPVVPASPKSNRAVAMSSLGLAAGAGTFGVAYVALGLAALASAGLAAVTAAVGAILVALMMPRQPQAESTTEYLRKDGEPLPEETAAAFKSHAVNLRDKLLALATAFDGVAASVGASEEEVLYTSDFVAALVSDELHDVVFESSGELGDAQATLNQWSKELGTWADLLDATVTPTAEGLFGHCVERSQALSVDDVLGSANVRATLRPVVLGWLKRWRMGIAPGLEIQSQQQQDTNGYRYIAENHVFASREFVAMLGDGLADSALKLGESTQRDFFVMTAVTDIALEGVSVLEKP